MTYRKELISNVISYLKPFASYTIQKNEWLDTMFFIEASCQLFDDTALSIYLSSNEVIISKECDYLLKKISLLIDDIDDSLTIEEIIAHKNMKEIQNLASKTISILNEI